MRNAWPNTRQKARETRLLTAKWTSTRGLPTRCSTSLLDAFLFWTDPQLPKFAWVLRAKLSFFFSNRGHLHEPQIQSVVERTGRTFCTRLLRTKDPRSMLGVSFPGLFGENLSFFSFAIIMNVRSFVKCFKNEITLSFIFNLPDSTKTDFNYRNWGR